MYNLTAYDIAIISGGFTIAGTLLGTWLGYRLTLQLSKLTTKREASRNFIATFSNTLSGLYPYPINWPENIDGFLRSQFNVLNASVSEFRHYLNQSELDAFDNAWFSFYNATGRKIDNENCQCYHHYMPLSGSGIENGKEVSHDTTQTYKATFKHNVDNLLKFAKIST